MEYSVEDWSCNPVKTHGLSLRAVVRECTALSDGDIVDVGTLEVGEEMVFSEFSVRRTA